MFKAIGGRDSGNMSFRLDYVVSALALLSLVGVPVAARSDETVPPPPTKVLDANHVNLISGGPSLDLPGISTAGIAQSVTEAGLTYTSGVTDYLDNFVGYESDRDRDPTSSNAPGRDSIVIGGKRLVYDADIFFDSCNSNICTYWDKAGVAYLFDQTQYTKTSDAYDGITGKLGMLVQINKPDGETIKITHITASSVFTTSGGNNNQLYTVHNVAIYYPISVVSSNGWMVKYEYDDKTYNLTGNHQFSAKFPKKIYIINTSYDYCDVAAASCTSSNAPAWPTLNIAYPATYSDAANVALGQFSPTGSTWPSGRYNAYSFAISHRVTDAYVDGMHTTYAYSWQDQSTGIAPYIITASLPDAATYSVRSEKANYQGTESGPLKYFYLDQISSYTDSLGRVTKYEYNDDNTAYRADNRTIKRIISPEATYNQTTLALTGGYSEYTYDARRNITSVSQYPKNGGAPLVTQYHYETDCTSANYKYCNKVEAVIDPNGKETDYTYSPVHGAVLTETGPAVFDPQAPIDQVNGQQVHPETRYVYTQLTPYIKNSAGVLVASTPVWRLTKTSSCRSATATNSASCVGTALETITDFEYNSPNLLLTKKTVRSGTANVTLPYSPTNLWESTTNTYDYVGDVVAVDGPRTDVDDKTYTIYDVRRRPVYEIAADPDSSGSLKRVVLYHHYDIDSREDLTKTGTIDAIVFDTSGLPTDVTNFVPTSFVRKTYDTTTGLLIKTEVGQP